MKATHLGIGQYTFDHLPRDVGLRVKRDYSGYIKKVGDGIRFIMEGNMLPNLRSIQVLGELEEGLEDPKYDIEECQAVV